MSRKIRCLLVSFSIIAIYGVHSSQALSVYLGWINGPGGLAINPKLTIVNERSYPPGSDELIDYRNVLQGNLTALKWLMAHELGYGTVKHVFYLENGAMIKVRDDDHLKSLDRTELTYYACKVPARPIRHNNGEWGEPGLSCF